MAPDLDRAAARFDEAYTRMTLLQRRLLATVRDGNAADPVQAHELATQANAVTAAIESAERAIQMTGSHSIPGMEIAALRARLLDPPVSAHAVIAVLRALKRADAYPLLADALRLAESSGGLHSFEGRRVGELLSAPSGVSAHTGHLLAEHIGIDPGADPTTLDETELRRLIETLHDSAVTLPEEVRPWRAGQAERLPDDAAGAAADVLARWSDELGKWTGELWGSADERRSAAWEAARRPGWPADGAPTSALLIEFTRERVMPLAVPTWEAMTAAAPGTPEEVYALLRSEERRYREDARFDEDEDETAAQAGGQAAIASLALRWIREALKAQGHADTQLARDPRYRRGTTPLADVRTVARRCGRLLAIVDSETATELIAQLPQAVVAEPTPRPS